MWMEIRIIALSVRQVYRIRILSGDVMEIEALKAELQSYIDICKVKWIPKLEEEYGGDTYKLYMENKRELFNDVFPIWQLSVRINAMENADALTFIKGSEDDMLKDLKYI